MLDIKKFSVNSTADIHLRGSDNKLLYDEQNNPVTITIHGPGSKEFSNAQAVRNLAMLEQLRNKGTKRADNTLEENAKFLASLTISFNNFQYGELTSFEQYKAFYLDTSLGFFAEQVNEELNDWSNFTKESIVN